MKKNKHFFIFRHGQTTYNLNGYIQGQTNDSLLTDKGKEQAFQIGEKLKHFPLDILLCSPLTRAKQTAQEVLKFFPGLKVRTEPACTEVNIGKIEGMHFEEVLNLYGKQYQKWRDINDTDLDFCFPNGESKGAVRKRAFSLIEHYLNNTDYQHIAISTHGIFLSQICLELNYPVTEIKNGQILHLHYNENSIKIEFIN